MKVLHVNTSDRTGGAARAAWRIHHAQRRAGIDSHMLVMDAAEPAQFIHSQLTRTQRLAQKAKLAVSNQLLARQVTTNAVLHSLNWFSSGLAQWINRSDYDVVNLHWLGGEMLSIEEIGRIHKPICWTMHDMWPFCGAEHYDDLKHPGRYERGYVRETRPATYSGLDLDAWVWRRKLQAWRGKRFHLISPSRWMAGCANRSVLMADQPCIVVPNCLDSKVFKPVERCLARQLLNLDHQKRYVLFGAMSSTSDARKGFHLLLPALQRLAQQPELRGNTELLVFGASEPANPPDFGLPTRYMGALNDELSLALLYNAADVFVAPSMQDNLPNTVLEALACGTPCVAFAVGGMVDLICNEMCGGLAKPFDTDELSELLYRFLDGTPRSVVSSMPSDVMIAAQYLSVYESSMGAPR